MEYISTSWRGEVPGLCSAEKQELGLGLTHSLTAALPDGTVWRGDSGVPWEGVYFKETLKEHDLHSQMTGDSH